MIPVPSWRQNGRRRLARLGSGDLSSASSRSSVNRPEKLPIGMEYGQQIGTAILNGNGNLETVKGVLPTSNPSILADLQDDRYFDFGSCRYLPSEYVGAVKDTIKGVLVEYYFQPRKHLGFESVSNTVSSSSTIVQKQKGILSREVEQQQYSRALGLVTINHTTTK